MPVDYTGDAAGISAHDAAIIPTYLDTDPCEAALDNAPLKALADVLAYLQANAALRGAIETAVFDGQGGDTNAAMELGDVPTTRKLKLRLKGDTAHARIYELPDGTIEITQNAVWTGSAWDGDNLGAASKVVLGRSAIEFHTFTVMGSTWLDSAWVKRMALPGDGRLAFTGTTTGASGSNPPAGTALANTVCAKNTCKAFASVSHVATQSTAEMSDGFNVASVALADSYTTLRITFAQAMADTNYTVSVTGSPGPGSDSTNNYIPRIKAKSTTHVDVGFNGWSNLQTPGWGLDVLVFGKQDS